MFRMRHSKQGMSQLLLQTWHSMPGLRRLLAKKPLSCFVGTQIETDEVQSCLS